MYTNRKKFLLQLWILHIIFILIGYYLLDKPISEWVHSHQLRALLMPYFGYIVEIPAVLIYIFPMISILIAFKYFFSPKLRKIELVVFIVSIATVVTYQIKNDLKWVFGRSWIETWKNNNPSWINDHVYGFNWFSGGKFAFNDAMASFPSGHTTTIFTIMCLLSFFYPKGRKVFLLLAFAEGLLLILFNYHFFSDVIAGMLLGWTSSILVYQFYLNQTLHDGTKLHLS